MPKIEQMEEKQPQSSPLADLSGVMTDSAFGDSAVRFAPLLTQMREQQDMMERRIRDQAVEMERLR